MFKNTVGFITKPLEDDELVKLGVGEGFGLSFWVELEEVVEVARRGLHRR